MDSSSIGATTSHVALLMLSRCPEGAISVVNLMAVLLGGLVITTVVFWMYPGGPAWGRLNQSCCWGGQLLHAGGKAQVIPGPRGWPIVGSLLEMGQHAHVRLAQLARAHSAQRLMALSLGETRVVLTCVPGVAREILNSPAFADRPIKQSAKLLLFHRAIGFAPYGDYWRKLRRIAATHLFSPKRIAALQPCRQLETSLLLRAVRASMQRHGVVHVRPLLQAASVNNIMKSVFGRRYDFSTAASRDAEALLLQRLIAEGFQLLGAFNWSDHLPFLAFFDPQGVGRRCRKLVLEVRRFVQNIIDEHRLNPALEPGATDFVDVMLSLQASEGLSDSDVIAILWEMIFRGTDTTAILMEWVLAEVVRHPDVQRKAQEELEKVVGTATSAGRPVSEGDVAKLGYVQAIVKETLRVHPPGPLLSWARLATHDVDIAGYRVPKGTTAMVNMWAITHDAGVWAQPEEFRPDRFCGGGGEDIDIRGNDLRLAPFGAGRRVCPGRALGLATVHLWAASLLREFSWEPSPSHPVDLSEVLKLSCEMKHPLHVTARPR